LGPKFALICTVGGIVYFIGAKLLRVKEADMVLRLVKSRYRKRLRKHIGA
jgi:hypothetical protein